MHPPLDPARRRDRRRATVVPDPRSADAGPAPVLLGIEAGGTRTVVLRVGGAGVARGEFGPANLRLIQDGELVAHFRAIAAAFPGALDALGIGMAGARTPALQDRIRRAAAAVWPGVPVLATHDLDTALAAAPAPAGPGEVSADVLVLSGTGSCCYARTARGRTQQFGGWGHLLGDKGSGYEIGLRALKAVVFYFDRDGRLPALGRRLLRSLQLNEPNEFIGWAHAASKGDIAALAPEVFAAASERDPVARDILAGAVASLANDAVGCARRVARPGRPVRFILAGSVLLRQPVFAARVGREIRRLWPRATVTPLARESAWGAVELARSVAGRRPGTATTPGPGPRAGTAPPEAALGRFSQVSPTEQRHPDSRHLDRLPVTKAIDLMLRDDARIPGILQRERVRIARVVKLVTAAFRAGGHLFYVGAGTSGRLGILDASECPPTFRVPPDLVQGIIAGGQTAIWRAVEGAEDDDAAGARAMEHRGVGSRDVVVGIAASGRTPFVWGALRAARARGAATVLVCFNPFHPIPRAERPDVVIAPNLGPEILTGSTRLKSGTATKLLLNIFTTLAMVGVGKVVGNLMVDLNPSNVKLRDRAERIVVELTGATPAAARAALAASGWVVRDALRRLKR